MYQQARNFLLGVLQKWKNPEPYHSVTGLWAVPSAEILRCKKSRTYGYVPKIFIPLCRNDVGWDVLDVSVPARTVILSRSDILPQPRAEVKAVRQMSGFYLFLAVRWDVIELRTKCSPFNPDLTQGHFRDHPTQIWVSFPFEGFMYFRNWRAAF